LYESYGGSSDDPVIEHEDLNPEDYGLVDNDSYSGPSTAHLIGYGAVNTMWHAIVHPVAKVVASMIDMVPTGVSASPR